MCFHKRESVINEAHLCVKRQRYHTMRCTSLCFHKREGVVMRCTCVSEQRSRHWRGELPLYTEGEKVCPLNGKVTDLLSLSL